MELDGPAPVLVEAARVRDVHRNAAALGAGVVVAELRPAKQHFGLVRWEGQGHGPATGRREDGNDGLLCEIHFEKCDVENSSVPAKVIYIDLEVVCSVSYTSCVRKAKITGNPRSHGELASFILERS